MSKRVNKHDWREMDRLAAKEYTRRMAGDSLETAELHLDALLAKARPFRNHVKKLTR